MDMNKTLLTGVCDTDPILTELPQSKTPLCYFTLRVDERFLNDKRSVVSRPNFFRIESLGRQAEATYRKVRNGSRYLVDGYLRQENNTPNKIDIVKVRTFGIIDDPTMDDYHYQKGLKKALDLIRTHRDLQKVKEILEEVLHER